MSHLLPPRSFFSSFVVLLLDEVDEDFSSLPSILLSLLLEERSCSSSSRFSASARSRATFFAIRLSILRSIRLVTKRCTQKTGSFLNLPRFSSTGFYNMGKKLRRIASPAVR